MVNIFFKKQHKIQEEINRYLLRLEDIMFAYREAFKAYLAGEASFKKRVARINSLENELDIHRRSIQLSMYEHSLMPDSREDILHLLDALDALPNILEHSIFDIRTEKPEIPSTLHAQFNLLIEKVQLVVKSLVKATWALFTDLRFVRQAAFETGRQESEADHLEFELLENIFSLDLRLSHKLQLKKIVRDISEVSDLGEDAAEILLIIAVKRAM